MADSDRAGHRNLYMASMRCRITGPIDVMGGADYTAVFVRLVDE